MERRLLRTSHPIAASFYELDNQLGSPCRLVHLSSVHARDRGHKGKDMRRVVVDAYGYGDEGKNQISEKNILCMA